ncbi:tyrosine-type recombinase/integrase [Bacillus inaquosorum]|uniref:tyrosine-type recombinase/integrase n=1 Tax=Bacillus inaquosorum TaxID=483913 RepID=UPI002281ED7B|nr:tyrosine-type recombinase/integrase [Bacillus inaquosorum]MCY7977725.1 tyrosine-type recombinase/integrase [Bacillus inaquosorum]MEC0591311.1 tyrosine-type recombinase/integrase [Bacillus inaquosorum]
MRSFDIQACCCVRIYKINPTENIQLPKQRIKVEEIENQEKVMKFLEKEEIALFLRLCDMKGLELVSLIFTTLAYTGLRIGELLALKWNDFNYEKRALRVTKILYNPSNNNKIPITSTQNGRFNSYNSN